MARLAIEFPAELENFPAIDRETSIRQLGQGGQVVSKIILTAIDICPGLSNDPVSGQDNVGGTIRCYVVGRWRNTFSPPPQATTLKKATSMAAIFSHFSLFIADLLQFLRSLGTLLLFFLTSSGGRNYDVIRTKRYGIFGRGGETILPVRNERSNCGMNIWATYFNRDTLIKFPLTMSLGLSRRVCPMPREGDAQGILEQLNNLLLLTALTENPFEEKFSNWLQAGGPDRKAGPGRLSFFARFSPQKINS